MKLIKASLFATGLLIFVACGNDQAKESISYNTIQSDTPISDFEQNANDTIHHPSPQYQNQNKAENEQQQNIDWDKKIIKTAILHFEVKDYNKFNTGIREKLKSLGSYIAQEEQNQSDYKIETVLSIKVPVDRFEEAINQLSAGAEKINEKKISSNDVTSEFFDTRSRMEAKKQVRLRYLELLKQAKNMEEILNVQSEINSIQEEIESAAGRIQYLGNSSSYSTINLTFYQVLNSAAKDEGKPSFGTKLNYAFKSGWNWVGDVFIGLITIWPLFLLFFIAFIIYKKNKLQKPKQAQPH